LLVLGHGAGGGIEAPDLLAARAAALECGFAVARVEQPYRVAGRRSPAPARALDLAWAAVVGELRAAASADGPLLVGGRSSGARVACRTATVVGADGVLCLAFPLTPPARRGTDPDVARPSRLGELDAVEVPLLVVQGGNDRFGVPVPTGAREVVVVEGDHGLKQDLDGVRLAVEIWLRARRFG
jgi:predicted alpha/beta-hydrolase family hydrolase